MKNSQTKILKVTQLLSFALKLEEGWPVRQTAFLKALLLNKNVSLKVYLGKEECFVQQLENIEQD